MSLRLTNPHSVLAALEMRAASVLEVSVPAHISAKPTDDDPWGAVAKLARAKGVKVQTASRGGSAPRNVNDDNQGGRAGLASAVVKESEGVALEELFAGAQERADGKGIWLALDSLQDPHNVGAIFRLASFFGIQGVLVTAERSAPLTATVYDVACGGVEYTPFTMQINLQRAFEAAKEAGLWILGTTEHQGDALESVKPDRPWLVVLGNEEKGMRRLTQESCDVLCRIPPQGKVTSLNVSTAAAVLMSRLTRKN
jgi:23S rRNA (guanosine2251-2'-O)-methyltransferase